jgi:hypothetical protein
LEAFLSPYFDLRVSAYTYGLRSPVFGLQSLGRNAVPRGSTPKLKKQVILGRLAVLASES